MKRFFILLCYASLISCQDKVICPAFQSTYILDDSVRNAYFSYVWQLDESTRTQFLAQQKGQSSGDSLGVVAQPTTDYYAYAGEKVVPWRLQKRTKYGIIKKTPYPIKNYQLRTAPMENVLAPAPVSNEFVAADFADSLGITPGVVMDSTQIDSIGSRPVAATEEEKKGPKYLYGYDPEDNYNVEQEYYNRYFGKLLVDNRPEPKPASADSLAAQSSDSVAAKEPFFKRLFKKKKKDKQEEEPTSQADDALPSEEEEEATESKEEAGSGNG